MDPPGASDEPGEKVMTDAILVRPMQMVAVLLETLDQHVSGRLDLIERQIGHLGNRMGQDWAGELTPARLSNASGVSGAGALKTIGNISVAPIAPNSAHTIVDVDADHHVNECLSRLSDAEASLAGVRHVLTSKLLLSRMASPLSCADLQDITLRPSSCSSSPSQSRCESRSKLPDKAISLQVETDLENEVSTTLDPFAAEVEAQDGTGGLTSEELPQVSHSEADKVKTMASARAALEAEIEGKVAGLAAEHKMAESTVRRVFEIFESANKAGDGLLTVDELEMLLIDMCDGAIEKSQVRFIMNRFDAGQDGMLHFEEFCAAFANTPLLKVAHIGDDLKNKSQETRNDLAEAGMRLQPEDWVQMMGCRTSSVKRYVNKEVLEAGSCLAMPLVFAMFALYFLSIVLHLAYEPLHAVDNAIAFDIKENANFAYGGDVPFENGRMGHKNIYDVNSFADFWSWLDLGIVPIFWAEGWELSEVRSNAFARCTTAKEAFDLYGWQNLSFDDTSARRPGMTTGNNHTNPYFCADEPMPERPTTFYANDQAGVYLYYHSVVAGVRLRQERGIAEPCPNTDGNLVQSLYKGQCVPATGYYLKPERQTSFGTKKDETDLAGGENVYLKSRMSQNSIRRELHDLEDRVWLSPETAKVEVLFTMYNPHLDIFSATFIIIFMNRGGHMYKMVEPVSTHLTPYRNLFAYAVDAALLLLVLKIMFGEGFEVYGICRLKGFRVGIKEYLSPSNAIDWLCVIYFFVLMGFWLAHIKQIADLRDSLRPASVDVPGSFQTISERDIFYDLVDGWVQGDSILRTMMAIFPFIIGTRFFKIFSLQPRLGVVTATLKSSFVDIVHFFMVFAAIFLVFVTSAMIIFGQEIEEFSNFSRSTMTVFRIMLGDYDSEEMIRVSRPQAAAWYWCFTWLVNLVMLNMLLAIVMDVHTEVKGHISQDAETMWSQVLEICSRWNDIRLGRQIPLEKVLESLELHCPTGHETLEYERLNLEAFMKIVPDVPEHQAMRLLVSTYLNDEEEGVGRGCSMSETAARVQHIFKNTQVLHTSIERLIHMQEITAEMVANQFAAMRSHRHHEREARKYLAG